MVQSVDSSYREASARDGLPCFGLFMSMLLWGMRNAREPARDESQPAPDEAPPALT